MVHNIVIADEAGYNGNLTGVCKKCTLYKCWQAGYLAFENGIFLIICMSIYE